jgi:hypothetical protein
MQLHVQSQLPVPPFERTERKRKESIRLKETVYFV